MTLILGVSRSESEITLPQEWDDRLTWNEKDVSPPFMTMILTSVTMLGWVDVPDSDRGDFRRRLAVDIFSLTNCGLVMPSGSGEFQYDFSQNSNISIKKYFQKAAIL